MGFDLKHRGHLFFDLDDTLWDFEKNSSKVLHELFSEFALEEKLNTSFENFNTIYQQTSRQLWARYNKKDIDKQHLRNHRFNLVFNRFGYDNYDENLLITNQYLQRAPRETALKAHCIETLNYLKENYRLHIITNGFKDVQLIKLEGSGLRNYFSNIIISEEHSLTKPDQALFKLAETMAGTHPGNCVMIGDNFECDVQGALNAGWEAIYFGKENELYEGRRISKLLELKELF